MIKAADLQVVIGADIKQAEREISQVQNRLTGFQNTVKKAGTVLSIGLTAPLALVAKSMIQTGVRAEQTRMAFTTLLGSAREAGNYLKELSDFAVKTPFELTELEDASRMMLAYGFSAKQVIPILRDVGDAAAGLGLGGEGIERIIRALGQMQQKGKVTADEMRQLSEAGIAGWRYLAESMGLTTAEVMKLSEKGLIPAQKAIDAILSGMRQDFGGMMEKQSQTAGGAISNLKDELERLGRSLSQLLIPTITDITRKITEFVQKINEAPPETQKLILTLGGVAIAAGPVLLAISNIITAIGKLRTALLTLQGLSLTQLLLGGGAITIIGLSLATITDRFYRFSSQVYNNILSVQEAWSGFLTELSKSGTSANAVLDEYNARQKEVRDQAGLVGKAVLWLSEQFENSEYRATELAQTLLKSSISYEDYRSAMERAGLSAQAYDEQQWHIIKGLEEQSARTRFLKDDYIELAGGVDLATTSTQTLTEYAEELVGQYELVMDSIKDITQEMDVWIKQTASLVASGLEEWFRGVTGSASSIQREIESLNEQIAKQKEKLKVTKDEDDRKRLQERIVELQRELAERTKELERAQINLEQSTIRYEAALAMVDEVMGTNYYSTYQLEKGVQALVDEYTRTGDLDAFKASLQRIKDEGLAPMKSALQDAVKQAQELYNKLMQLPEEIRISIKIDAPSSITIPTPTTVPVPNSGGGTNSSTILPRQLGGPVFPNRTYLVGERGPELFVPKVSGEIVSTKGDSFNIVINATVEREIDIRGLAEEVVYRIKSSRSFARVAL